MILYVWALVFGAGGVGHLIGLAFERTLTGAIKEIILGIILIFISFLLYKLASRRCDTV